MAYDSAERRRELAASLEGVADDEAVEAVVVADTSQGAPADVSSTPRRAPVVGAPGGTGGVVRSTRRSERGR